MPTRSTESESELQRSIDFNSFAGNLDPAARSAILCIPEIDVTGIMPAIIGTLIPASSHRSLKSKKS